MGRHLTWSRLRRVRQIVQAAAFSLYVILLFAALQQQIVSPLTDLFFRLDPLAAAGAMLAARAWIPRLALALVILGLTLLLGRVWCGWLCPLGTLLDWVRFPSARRREVQLSSGWKGVKYLLLLLTLALALLRNLSLLILDPITLLTRTMTTAVLPALNQAITAVERAMYPIGFLRPAIDWIEQGLRGPVLPVVQPVFAMSVLTGLLFAGILALNLLAPRFWCRALCPLGALLGWLSKVSLLRPLVGPACNRCGQCGGVCPVGAIDIVQHVEIAPAECIACLDCLVACPESVTVPNASPLADQRGIGFRRYGRPAPAGDHDPTRRQALTTLVAGAAGAALLRTAPHARQLHPQLIRPPGAQDEDEFLSRCLRCGQCMRVCPTSGLQPMALEAGLEGVWTPRLVARLGYCDYGCNACGQACPSGAIPLLDLEQKRSTVIGMAVVNRNRCWPWAYGVPCIVCEEMCPAPEKAIRLEEVTVTDARGEPTVVQRPFVLEDLCIGCGICEYRCPVEGPAAIRVRRAG
ncbi:MAG: 4Fe-4S binding protein [Anaerolineae bacterium]|jgi:MauM/NapG family ferredoxin protein